MNDVVIRAEGLSKKYLIGHQREGYVTLRDAIASSAKRFARTTGDVVRGRQLVVGDDVEEFWALSDVSFDIRRGDVVGIIGRNGAGKSTLLKILSRITEPSAGRLWIKGRLSTLLEVGTGFHPELTGRENIYLNGTLLGMGRTEIKKKFDEIVAFAEVHQFLDTPVKHYSSGMYVRLAFAVAAHLDSKILLVDEVLAVGDAEFQKKCLAKMKGVSRSGRTVLFVSHNMNAIEDLCTSALALHKGKLLDFGTDVRGVVGRHLDDDSNVMGAAEWRNDGKEYDHPVMQPLYLMVVTDDGHPLTTAVRNDEQLYVVIGADVRRLDPALCIGFTLYNQDGLELLRSLSTDSPEAEWPAVGVGRLALRCALPKRFLNEGRYRIELDASLHYRDWFLWPGHNSPSVSFEIRGGLSESPYWIHARSGLLAPEWKWTCEPAG